MVASRAAPFARRKRREDDALLAPARFVVRLGNSSAFHAAARCRFARFDERDRFARGRARTRSSERARAARPARPRLYRRGNDGIRTALGLASPPNFCEAPTTEAQLQLCYKRLATSYKALTTSYKALITSCKKSISPPEKSGSSFDGSRRTTLTRYQLRRACWMTRRRRRRVRRLRRRVVVRRWRRSQSRKSAGSFVRKKLEHDKLTLQNSVSVLAVVDNPLEHSPDSREPVEGPSL